MMEALRSSEMSVHTRATHLNIPGNGIIQPYVLPEVKNQNYIKTGGELLGLSWC
jgi:hypothetical protein